MHVQRLSEMLTVLFYRDENREGGLLTRERQPAATLAAFSEGLLHAGFPIAEAQARSGGVGKTGNGAA